jgi:hypothetical protein
MPLKPEIFNAEDAEGAEIKPAEFFNAEQRSSAEEGRGATAE